MKKSRKPIDLDRVVEITEGTRAPKQRLRPIKLMAVCVAVALIVVAVLMPVTSGVILATNVVSDAWNSQPDVIPQPPLPGRTTLVGGPGKKFAEVFSTNRIPVSAEQQGELARHAIVAIEDARFYKHGGLDFVGMLRALKSSGNGQVQGGSTITQQYAKNLNVTQALVDQPEDADRKVSQATERSWRRKLAEAHLAVLIESKMTKDEILTGYLNIAYFGAGAYGIEAAARRYFSVPAAKLSLTQAATLAGIVQSPAALDPRTNPTRALDRRNQVLTAMQQSGYITSQEAQAAAATPMEVNPSSPSQGCAATQDSWGMACDAVMQELRDAQWLGQEPRRLIANGGLTVTTTLDPKTQKAAYQSARQIIPADNRVANAVVVVQPGTGDVKAIASNRAFGVGKGLTEISLGTTESFSPGSTFKLFTLLAALEEGIPLETRLPGGTSYTSNKFDNPPDGYHNAEGLSASNVTITEATTKSINTAYVQLEEMVGIDSVADVAQRMGITSIGRPGSRSYPGKREGSFALGVRDVSVIDMAGAYAAVAAHGRWCKPSLIKSVTLPSGQVVTNPASQQCHQAVEAPVADTAASVLKRVIEDGTGKSAKLDGRDAAGKTGTGEDAGSAWFAGFTPQAAAAVWTGDPRSPKYTLHDVLGLDIVYGGTLPAELWKSTMTAYLQGKPAEPLPEADPAYLLGTGAPVGDQVTMMDLRGQPIDVAKAMLQTAGLQAGTESTAAASQWIQPGTVVEQSQEPGAVLPPGTKVNLTVSPS